MFTPSGGLEIATYQSDTCIDSVNEVLCKNIYKIKKLRVSIRL